jgi:GDP-mannose 6-dehydrogenase
VNVTVFGLGYVGTVTATCLAARGHRVVGVDVNIDKVMAVNSGRSPVVEPGLGELLAGAVGSGSLVATESVSYGLESSDLSIICVGTPSALNGSTDLSYVRKVVAEIGAVLAGSDRPHTVVVRSTVPPGTVDDVVAPLLETTSGRVIGTDLHAAMCPEFLREGSSVADFFAPPFLVIGGTTAAAAAVTELFGFLDCSIDTVPIRAAESIKYACNAFHAVKVSFANELSRLYRMLDVDSRRVMEVFVQDRQLNISPAYLRPGFAFGGSCLPKDLRSLLYLGRMHSVDLPLLQASLTSNDILIREVADRILLAVDSAGGSNRRVALLGLSFKQNTDDLRESPNVALAEILLGKGLEVSIHDPLINLTKLTGTNLSYVRDRLPHLHKVLHDNPAAALKGAHVAVVFSADETARAAVAQAAPPVVFDLNGRMAELEMLAGYQGVGW